MSVTIDHPTDRPNFTRVGLGSLTLWFSYRTCVAFDDWADDQPSTVRENEWGPTTGKHLNYIDDGNKASRVGSVEFVARLRAKLDAMGLEAI